MEMNLSDERQSVLWHGNDARPFVKFDSIGPFGSDRYDVAVSSSSHPEIHSGVELDSLSDHSIAVAFGHEPFYKRIFK
jgi:hypothetical protein